MLPLYLCGGSLLRPQLLCADERRAHRVVAGILRPAEIHLQGMFYTKKFESGTVQYWVYRNHDHSDADHDHEHEHGDGEISGADMIPIEVMFSEDVEIPEDGTWVDIVGIVGPDSTKSLSGIREAKMTLMDEPGNEYVE